MENNPSALPGYISTLLKTGLGFVGGVLVSKGLITAEQATELTGAAILVIGVVYGLIAQHGAHTALKAAIAAPAGQAK
jgi:hypothetical protein